jgi:hypothetical protein
VYIYYVSPEGFVNLAKFLPTFGEVKEPLEGLALVGLNLKDGTIRYYTGTEWETIRRLEVSSFEVSNKEFFPQDAWRAFIEFYFETERRPRELNLDFSNYSDWKVSSGFANPETMETHGYFNPFQLDRDFIYSWITILVEPKEGYIQTGPDFYFLDARDNFREGNFRNAKVIRRSDLLDKFGSQIRETIKWRDQILEEGEFEKFINLKVDGVDKKYDVKKIDEYIFVDLDRPVQEGTGERYSTAEFIEPIVGEKMMLVNNAKVEIAFEQGDVGLFGIWKTKSHRYEWVGIEEGWFFDGLPANSDRVEPEFYAFYGISQKEFYRGLTDNIVLILNSNFGERTDASNIHVFIIDEFDMRKEVEGIEFVDNREIERNIRAADSFIDSIIQAYNAEFKEISEETAG